jgi:hypothetical protein
VTVCDTAYCCIDASDATCRGSCWIESWKGWTQTNP